MVTKPTIARIWRGRTRREVADSYEPYLRAERIELHRILVNDPSLR
ncbi:MULTISPECIES: hypothetical protein [Agrobacterium]|nr:MULTISPECIES: hypothetical protein [Agrobacterium]MBW9060299.1 hypothetical protein [Agrobacterium pusense]